MLLPLHLAAGSLAIILGTAALLSRKGGITHRRAGIVFVYAMLTMGFSGSILAARHSLTNANVLGGLVSAYFVVSAWATVHPYSRTTRRLTIGALVLAVGLVLVELMLAIKAFGQTPSQNRIDGLPFRGVPLFAFAVVTALAAYGDVRLLRLGVLPRVPRLTRHLWRMCFGLFIAVGSFFSLPERVGKILPQAFTTPPMRMLPMALVFGAMFYGMWRARRPVNP
jgi:hypothetical protein